MTFGLNGSGGGIKINAGAVVQALVLAALLGFGKVVLNGQEQTALLIGKVDALERHLSDTGSFRDREGARRDRSLESLTDRVNRVESVIGNGITR